MNRLHRIICCLAISFVAFASNASAQLTWDTTPGTVGPGDSAITSGNGTWDTTTGNWTSDAGANNVAWTNGNNATFGSGTYQVDLTTGSLVVGDVTYGGGGTLEFRGSTASGTAGDTITVNPGATWDTGGGEIEFFNDGNDNNTRLSMASGTLTVQGGGTFDTGQNPQNNDNGTWQVSGATLDVTGATQVRGHTRSVGQFATVKMADGTSFIQERNADQTMANAWELTGDVTFGNRFTRKTFMTGVISGTGRLIYQDGGNQNNGFMRIDNAANTFSGGLTVDAANNNTMVFINSTSDGALGAAPGSFDADNIILKNDGTLRFNQNITVNANRGITLDTGGIINVTNGRTAVIEGAITGDGGLQVGYATGQEGTLELRNATSDYTGGTQVFEGNLRLGANEVLSEGVLTIGGEGTSRLILNRFSQTINGLNTAANNTREVVNLNSSSTTLGAKGELIIDVADDESYTFGSAYGGNQATQEKGNFSTVKNGLGTQQLNNMKVSGDLTVNAGLMVINDADAISSGATSVTGGTLRVNNSLTSASFATSDSGTLQIGNAGGTGTIGDVNVANDGTVTFSRTTALTYSGVISGSGDVRLNSNVALTLGATQTYTGTTFVGLGSLTATAANQLSADSVLNVGGFSGGTSAVELAGFDQEVGGLQQNGGNTRQVQNTGGTATLTINVGAGEEYSYGANFAGDDTINLVKTGAGKQTITRGTGYSNALGTLAVNAGELVWNVTNGDVGEVTVADGATLSGEGIFGEIVTVAGNLNPGNSPGKMDFGMALTLDGTATTTLEFESDSDFDVLNSTGTGMLTVGGTLELTLLSYAPTAGQTFDVFTNWKDGSGNDNITGSFDSINVTGLDSGLMFDTSNLLTTGQLTVTAVPEPSAAALLAIGLGVVAVRRRKR